VEVRDGKIRLDHEVINRRNAAVDLQEAA